MSKIIYNISGRNFKEKSLGRKIYEVITCWKRNHNIEVICGGDIGQKEEASTSTSYGNANHYNQSYRKNKLLEPLVHSVSEIKDIIHDKKMYEAICEKYDNQDIKLVWERSSRLHYAGYRYAKKRGVPFVLEWKDHLIDYKFSLLKPFAQFIENYKNKNADYLVVESNVLREQLAKEGVDKNKILVAYNAVNADEFKPSEEYRTEFRNFLNIDENCTLVGYLGSYAFYHDTKRLILAANIIKKSGVKNIKILLVGNGKEFKECYELAKELNLLEDMVIFKEGIPKEQVPKVLSALDISILPGSTDIICPIKVFEYMAAQTLCIVPNYDCNKEVIEDGVDGVLFKPFDEKDLADKIVNLHEHPQNLKQMAKNARVHAQQKFTWENTWAKVMNEIVQKSCK